MARHRHTSLHALCTAAVGVVMLCAAAIPSAAQPACADDESRTRVVATVDVRASTGVLAIDSHLLVTASEGLWSVDVGSPVAPTKADSLLWHGEQPLCIAREGDRAYVGCESGVLYVVDATSPATPTTVANIPLLISPLSDISIRQQTAFIVAGGWGLLVVSLQNPELPVVQGTLLNAAQADAVWVEGNTAIATTWTVGVQLIDITNPAAPTLQTSIDTPGVPRDVAAAGRWVFVADDWSGVQVIDLQRAGGPGIVATIPTNGSARRVALHQDTDLRLVVLCDRGIALFDVDSPTAAVPLGTVGADGPAGDAVIASGHLYVPTNGWMNVVELGDWDPIVPVSSGLDPFGSHALDIVARGGFAYVASLIGLYVVDVSDPALPVDIGTYEYTRTGPLALLGNSDEHVALWADGVMRVMDVSTPSVPHEVGSYPLPVEPWDLTADGNYLYVGEVGRRLTILDMDSPQQPSLVESIFLPDTPMGVQVRDGYAYISANGLYTVDVTDAAHAHIVDFDPISAEGAMAMIGQWGYVPAGGVVNVVDLSQPASPEPVAQFPIPALGAFSIRAVGLNLVTAGGGAGVVVLDASAPTSLRLVGTVDTPGFAWSVTSSLGHLHVADGSAGLTVLKGPCDRVTAAPIAVAPAAATRIVGLWPNPMFDDTAFAVDVRVPGGIALGLFDAAGRRVRTISRGSLPAGVHRLSWDGRDDRGRRVASGVYQLLLEGQPASRAVPVVVLR